MEWGGFNRARGDASAAAALLAIVVIFVTLYPFGFVRTGEVYVQQLRQAVRDPADLMLPVHALPAMVGVWLLAGSRAWKRRWVPALVVCAALVALELVQAGIARRHARAGDLAVQWLGAGVGVMLLPMARRVGGMLMRARGVLWTLAMVVWVAMAGLVAVRGQMGHAIAGWDESFPFMLGDEYQGGRRWSGVIHRAGVYAGAIEEPGELERQGAELASVVYDLARGPASLGTIAFDLRTKGVVYSDSGMDLDAGHFAQGQRPASELSRAIMEASGATIEVECTPAVSEQFGPARLVSISKGMDYRNLTLAQEGASAVLRVRTPRAGANGDDLLIGWPNVFEAGKRVRLVVTTTGGVSRLWVNGEDRGAVESISGLGDWMKVRSAGRDWIAGAVLFLPMGLIAARLVRGVRGAGMVAFAGAGIAAGAALGLAFFEGRSLPIEACAIGLACAALGLVLGVWMSRGGGRRIEPPAGLSVG